MKREYLYIFLITAIFSCSPEKTSTLKASFSYESGEVLVGNTLNFINKSEGVTENTDYLWEFGDGTSSNIKDPSHTYLKLGNYTVTLKLRNGSNNHTAEKEVRVSLSNDIDGRKPLIEKLSDNEILICAHRAYDKDKTPPSPENSIAAINDAIVAGIDMIELDVRETRDGELVILHDETIDRTTNGIGNVASYSLEEIQAFKLNNINGELTNERIPSLKEVLTITRGKIYIALDISKKASFDRVYPLVKHYGMIKQVLFYSSRLNVIKEMASRDPNVIAMPIIDGVERFNDYERLNNIKVVHYTNVSFNKILIDKAKAKGWYIFMNAYINTNTVPDDDNYSLIDKISSLSGNIIQTDHSILVQKHLKN